MRVFEYGFTDIKSFRTDLNNLKKWCNANTVSNVLFHVYTLKPDDPDLGAVLQSISSVIPRALYVGASSNGNVLGGEISEHSIVIVATVFEDNDTTVQLHQYSFTDDNEQNFSRQIVDMVNSNPNIKAVEFLLTIKGMSMTGLCQDLSEIRDDVVVIGGAALNEDMDMDNVIVFSKVGDISDKSIAVILYGGKNLHADSIYIGGWSPIGHKMKVTRADRNRLYELDGKPAYDVYHDYLGISNDNEFFHSSMGFPLITDIDGVSILRAPTACYPDGSLNMTADITEGVMANLAYGDPWAILKKVNEAGHKIAEFAPQAIAIYSCATRKVFWDSSSIETKALGTIAPATGFYTAGEFIRTGKGIYQHNVTLVISYMREGDIPDEPGKEYQMEDLGALSGQESVVGRLANYLGRTTQELDEANTRLSVLAVTDVLSQLFNRVEIQRRVSIEVLRAATSGDDDLPSLIMLDVDNFKSINDCCGHNEGDNVIKGLAKVIKEVIDRCSDSTLCYRWGDQEMIEGLTEGIPCAGRWSGEEFLVLLPSTTIDTATEIADMMRAQFEATSFPQTGHQTISAGVVRAVRGENVDVLCGRAEAALKDAKKEGKNRVIVR